MTDQTVALISRMKIEDNQTVTSVIHSFGHFISTLWLPSLFGAFGFLVDSRERFVLWLVAGFLCSISLELTGKERR